MNDNTRVNQFGSNIVILDLFLYYAIVVVPTVLLYRTRYSNKKWLKYRIAILIACLVPSFFYGIRYDVGTDWLTYKMHYDFISLDDSWAILVLEPGFYCLMSVCKTFGTSFYGFSFVCCILLEFAILKALSNFNLQKEQWLGYFLSAFSVYFVAYNITRQMIATSFLLLSYSYFIIEKKKKSIIWLILAISFHKSAIMGIIILIINRLYKRFGLLGKTKTLLVSLLLSCASMAIVLPLIAKLQSMGIYNSIEYQAQSFKISELGFLLYYIPEWFLIYIFMKRYSDIRLFECFAILMLGGIFQFVGCIYPFADRLSWYFVSFRILLYPMIALELNKKGKQQFHILAVSWFLFYFFVMFYLLPGNKLFPYQTLFQQ